MRLACLVVAVAATSALAEAPEQFRASAAVNAAAGQSLQRLALPLEAYRDARRDLADIRIFNGKGDPVPLAFAAAPPAESPPPETVPLRVFPITPVAADSRNAGPGTRVAVTLPDGTRVHVAGQGAGLPAPAKPVTSWLLDAGEGDKPLDAMVFEWREGEGTQMPRVRIEASGDLKAWTHVANAPLVRLAVEGRKVSQPRATFSPHRERYYLVTVEAGRFDLVSATGERETSAAPANGLTREIDGQVGERPGEFLYDLGAVIPLRSVALVPQTDNAVLVATFSSRGDARDPWREVTSATFYRLSRDGRMANSPAHELSTSPARYWRVRLAPGSTVGPAPRLRVTWMPAQLVFVAQEPEPFTLAFGRAKASAAALPVSSLLPGYKAGDEWKLPEATVGAVAIREPQESLAEKVFGEVSPKRAGLWAVLLAGVGLLGFMAWRLSR